MMELKDINDLKPGNKKKVKKRRPVNKHSTISWFKNKHSGNRDSESSWSEKKYSEYLYAKKKYSENTFSASSRSVNKPSARSRSINSKPILSLLLGLGFLSIILIATMFTAGATTKGTGATAKKASDAMQTEELNSNNSTGAKVLGVVTAIQPTENKIELYDVEKETPVTYTYSGGTDITDKYGQPIAISQIQVGSMVEGSYPPNQARLDALSISTRAWEYVGVNNLSIDRSNKVMQIASTKYKYTDDIKILDGDQFIPVANLAEQDELTVWGYDQTIWSITVTRGHGTVRLTDYDSFLGDFITIGYEAIQQIVADMTLTVREGNFNLTVENEKYTATKNITVYRNKETVVSLSDLGPVAAKVGRVTFEIKPFGADLYLDGVLTSYANPIELEYGEHDLLVSLEGYTAYDGKLMVDAAGKTIRIELSEETSKEDASVSETSTGSGKNASGTNTSGTNTTSGNTNTDQNEDNNYPNTNSNAGTDNNATQSKDIKPNLADNVSNKDFEADEEHLIEIQNPVGASVYLNGEYMCESPGSFKKLIGTHVLTFIKEGYETTSYTVEVPDNGKNATFSMPDLLKK